MQLKERKEYLVVPAIQKKKNLAQAKADIEQKSQASADAYSEKLRIYFFFGRPRKARVTNYANYANCLSWFLRLVGPLAKRR